MRLPARGRRALRDLGYVHVELIATIVLDTLVLIIAIAARWAALKALRLLGPVEQMPWAVRRLEWIGDVGIVSAAAIFMTFDLAKRLVLAIGAFVRTIREMMKRGD
jgi:hypothetical protein